MNFTPAEKASTFRQPSTANLMIDSADRSALATSSAFDFQIARTNSILNGYFTRVATTEVVLEWCEENISDTLGNRTLEFDISGVGGNTYAGVQTISLISGFYTAAEAYNAIVLALNDVSGTTGAVFNVSTAPGGPYLEAEDASFSVNASKLARQLDLDDTDSVEIGALVYGVPISCPDLRPYRYIDFVCQDLTYAQDLKDSSTALFNREVLCRWYFSWDSPPLLDAYGYPILMGYTRFCVRRIFNPPKQIKWTPNLPIGNLTFQTFDDEGLLLPSSSQRTNFLMTLQVSEV